MAKCHSCGRKIDLPFRCNHCGQSFCSKHRLPPNHDCSNIEEWEGYSGPSIGTGEKLRSWIAGLRSRVSRGEPPRRKVSIKPREPIEYPAPDYPDDTTRRGFSLPRVSRRVKALLFVTISILVVFGAEVLFAEDLLPPTYYLLMAIAACFLTYILYGKVSRIRTGSHGRLFGLRILSGILAIGGALLIGFTITAFLFAPIFSPQISSEDPIFIGVGIFLVVLGLGLMLVGAFLYFRFMRESGIIVYPR